MDDVTTRIVSVELRNFKNITHGKIEMPSASKKDHFAKTSDILGIYGQNGSGKTAVVDAFFFLKILLEGESLPDNTSEYIAKSSNEAECTFTFSLGVEKKELLVEYTFELSKDVENLAYVSYEKISYKKWLGSKWSRKTILFEYKSESEDRIFTPISQWEKAIADNKDARVNYAVAKKLSIKERTSFFFSKEFKDLMPTYISYNIMPYIVFTLSVCANKYLFVIRNSHIGAILPYMILLIKVKVRNECIYMRRVSVLLSEPTVQELEVYTSFSMIIREISSVLQALVPGMTLEIKEYGKQMTKDGREGIKFEVLSVRGENKIPIKYESEGIKKLILLLQLLIAMYNDPSICVVIDELDAGIFEYLLGELLCILQESGKGQLIFTSHNLRPLEMIDKNNLIFTTTNPDNRFIRLTNLKTNNNTRDQYIRSINLGGQKENIYEASNSFEINRAFRRAVRDLNEQK